MDALTFSAFHFKKGQRVALRGPYDQKSLKLERSKFFITKISTCKFAIGKAKLDLVGLAVIFPDEKMRTMETRDFHSFTLEFMLGVPRG